MADVCWTMRLPAGWSGNAANTAQRKILTDWHATFRLPVKITEAGRETSTAYDTRGNVTSRSIGIIGDVQRFQLKQPRCVTDEVGVFS